MIELTLNLYKITFFAALLTNTINVSRSYKKFLIEEDTLCSPLSKHIITLESGEQSAAIVSLRNMARLKEHAKNWGSNDFICEFQIKAREKNGIFAVIQNIHFRRNKSTNECIDYVEYTAANSTVRSKKYCGTREPLELMPSSNSFVEPSNTLDVYINISRTPFKPYRKLELEIVFTSFRYCLPKLLSNDHWCSPNYAIQCIHNKFINDSYINCPYPGCVDEGKCIEKSQIKKSAFPQSASIFISLLASASLLFGIWVGCKIKRHFNQRAATVSSNNTSHYNASQFIEMTQVPPIDDNPPSYESLFPNRPTS